MLVNTYKQLPVTFAYGKGCWLYDFDNNQYLDALCGIAVTGLGHAHPQVTAAITEQASKLLHVSNIYTIEQQLQIATKLTNIAGLDQAFFCNSGTEALETAIKFARKHGHANNITAPGIIVTTGAFHGRTMGALSAGGNTKLHQDFTPLLAGFTHLPYNDIDAINNLPTKNIAAILVEPIQGEGGINIPSPDYLAKLRNICDANNWLLIFDEVQTGMGRTGKMFCYQHSNVKPDILTLAKGIANGIPMGACLVSTKVGQLFAPGDHGSTFGGNPLACSAAIATCDAIINDKLWENAAKQGEYILQELTMRLQSFPEVINIRGQGLMIGIELNKSARAAMTIGLKHKILFNVVQDKTIRLLPPLIITQDLAEEIVVRMLATLQEFLL